MDPYRSISHITPVQCKGKEERAKTGWWFLKLISFNAKQKEKGCGSVSLAVVM